MVITREELEKIKNKFEIGLRVKLISVTSTKLLRAGDVGIIKSVSEEGNIGVIWNNGMHLPVVYGKDICETMNDYRSEEVKAKVVKDLKYLQEYDIVRNFRCTDDVMMEAHFEAMPELMSYIMNHKDMYLKIVDEYGF